ncbi:hypothetical protein OAU50_02255 [Planctomycetota bacterium]|nr:hypothetical protein [Planctomycetota bacterium]
MTKETKTLAGGRRKSSGRDPVAFDLPEPGDKKAVNRKRGTIQELCDETACPVPFGEVGDSPTCSPDCVKCVIFHSSHDEHGHCTKVGLACYADMANPKRIGFAGVKGGK